MPLRTLSDFNLTDGTSVGRHWLVMGKIAVENRAVWVTDQREAGSAMNVFTGMFEVVSRVMLRVCVCVHPCDNRTADIFRRR